MPSPHQHDDVPLCVDLDGTLLKGDTTWIACRQVLMRSLTAWPRLAWALFVGGRLGFKATLSRIHRLDPATLPWREEIVEWLRGQSGSGRRLVLATAAPTGFAVPVAGYLGIFEGVLASDSKLNIKAYKKVTAILVYTGGRAFDYIGDSRTDLPIFAAARRCILVTSDARLLADARKCGEVEAVFPA